MVSTGGFLIGIEALLIGQRFGLDPAVMTDVLNAATGMNELDAKEVQAVRSVAEVQRGVHDGAAGEGFVHCDAGRPGNRHGGAAEASLYWCRR